MVSYLRTRHLRTGIQFSGIAYLDYGCERLKEVEQVLRGIRGESAVHVCIDVYKRQIQEAIGYTDFFWLVMICCFATVVVTIFADRRIDPEYGKK